MPQGKGATMTVTPPSRSLLLLRHAKSAWPDGVADLDRPLARRGERAADQIGQFLLTHDLVPDRVVSSPARRTRETAERVLAAIGEGPPTSDTVEIFLDDRYYDGDAYAATLEHLALASRLMVVGHEPDLVDLARRLAGAEVRLPTAGLVWLEVQDATVAPAPTATVRLVLPPKLLEGGGRA
jgi:phosphohistidine phosphatase